MRNTTGLLALFAILLCSGCGDAIDVKVSLDAYHAAQPCCSSFDELNYREIPYPADLDFSIDDHSPVFDFGRSGKSRFVAFKLPEVGTPYHLDLRSYFMRDGTDGAVFFPLVTFLDAEKKPIYTSDAVELSFVDNLVSDEPLKPVRLRYMTEVSPRDRYIVIHTSRDLIESGRVASKPEPVRVAASTTLPLAVPMLGPAGPKHRKGLPVGSFKLRLEEEPKL
jgi:hypothetical protein